MKQKAPNRIASIRKDKGLTQQQLGDALGVHWITISKIERGVTELNGTWLRKLSEALGVPKIALLDAPIEHDYSIYGTVADGRTVHTTEADNRPVVRVSDIPETGSWFELQDDSLGPFFHKGDLLHFHWTVAPPKRFIGRVVMVRTPLTEGKYHHAIGVLTDASDGATNRVVNLRGFNGMETGRLEVDTFGVLTMSRMPMNVKSVA
jgi:transcriptional regulator with XRE-family HTH domain